MKKKITEKLNIAHRSEITAVQSYEFIINSLDDSDIKMELSSIKDYHSKTARVLANQIEPDGDHKVDGFIGATDLPVRTFTEAANMFNTKASIKALGVAEEHGVNLYQSILVANPPVEIQKLISEQIMPNQLANLNSLERMEGKL